MATYYDFYTDVGILRVTYEMTAGDIVLSGILLVILIVILVKEVIKATWGR